MAAGDSITYGNFTFTETSIEGVLVVDVKAYGDERGYFAETYKRPDFVAGGIDAEFVQDNQSSSTKGVLRGLHFQIEHPQSKLVRVVSGEVFDVAVDLRVHRLIERHIAHGRSPQAAREWVLRSDEANARLVAATADRADVVVRLSEQQEPDERAEP